MPCPCCSENEGISSHWVPAVMTVGQISEFPALILLPLCLKKLKLKATFALGMLAWVVRYTLFALDIPMWLILCGIALHGVCHVYLVIVIQLYVDRQCRPDLRASAQNLFAFVTMGVAMPIGFLLAGKFGQHFHLDDPARADYRGFFSIDAAAIALVLIIYWFSARLSRNGPPNPHRRPIRPEDQCGANVSKKPNLKSEKCATGFASAFRRAGDFFALPLNANR